MRIIYPADSFNPKQVDEVYEEECRAAKEAGMEVSIFNFEEFLAGGFFPKPKLIGSESVLYRGWMLGASDYQRLAQSITVAGCRPITSPEAYLLCHHLPRWYPLLREFSAETRFYDEHCAHMGADLADAGWTGCFLKDYVKSLSTHGGSLVHDLNQIPVVVEKMRKFRGQIEGGLCARRIESYDPVSERRYFVLNGQAQGDGEEPPPNVMAAAALIQSPFFSVDVAMRADGVMRIVELGDGQVSDRKHWSSEEFIRMLSKGL
ncbi:MAG TPA: ATP-grasp domain-containing protein [Prosthecobacter sp.]|nr:ATP-grasp domain-containing protein [Prosthecobacter sp.]